MAILDARSRVAFMKSHIPGALHADLFHYFIPGTDGKGLAMFHGDIARLLGKLGLTGRETIVVYESNLGIRAARVAWMLEYAGSPKVFLLEGGFTAWRKAGLSLERQNRKPETRDFNLRPNSKILATAGEISKAKKAIVLDVRSEGEFTGNETRDCDERKGRIPGSRWLEWKKFLEDGKRFRKRPEMTSILNQKSVYREDEVVTYCHRGARAAVAFYALRSLGFKNVKNYIGSWHEWSARKELPVALGHN